jgi:hypothetical protein
MTRMFRRSGGVAVLAATAALGLAACGGSAGSPQVASLGKSSSNGGGTSGGNTTVAAPKGNATKLADEWAACERSHGDINQADPVIGIHYVIYITRPGPGGGGGMVGNPHEATGECSQYLVAAQTALRDADPVQDPLGVTNTAMIVNFASCMRNNGIPNYPYPSGPNDSQTNFNGTGVDPFSPSVARVDDLCGKKLGLPTWWINGWGPPGSIVVSEYGQPLPGAPGYKGPPPACAFAKNPCGATGGPGASAGKVAGG